MIRQIICIILCYQQFVMVIDLYYYITVDYTFRCSNEFSLT